MSKGTATLAGIALALALFFAANILASQGLRSARLDLTEGKLYTLSEGSRRIAAKLDEPVHLYFYFAEQVASQVPEFKAYGSRVRELLEEYELRSNGRIVLERVEPERFSEEEDRAVEEGLVGAPLGADVLYFGLVGTNSTGDREVIKFFDSRRERFLEYDVTRLIHTLAHPEKPLVGVLTGLPLEGAPGNPMMGMQGVPGWQILEQIRQFFDVQVLSNDLARIPADVDLLLVVHPRDFSDGLQYAIDQFVLAGGKTVVLVDPHCEADQSGSDPMNPMASMGTPKGSDLPRLLDAWGIDLVDGKIAGDRRQALRVGVGNQELDYMVWLGLQGEAFDATDPVTSLLRQMIVPTAGVLRKKEGATTEVVPLLKTSDEAMKIDVGMVQFMPDPKALITQYVPEYEVLTLAARVRGTVSSAFPEGKPAAPPVDPEQGAEPEPEADAPHLAESAQPIQLIVVADADFLADRFWIQEERLFGQISLGWRKTSDNGDFLINALENMAGGDDLISVRARGQYSRPFEKVEEIRRDAEQRFLDEEQALQSKLSAAQARINELQREKSGDDALILSPAQQQELVRAREDELATRKRLREVQHGLNQDIERLGLQVKGINILALPLLVSTAALALGTWRRQHRAR